MKRVLLIALLASLAIVPSANDLSGADDRLETLVGLLSYAPKPDVSICFCGSFRLDTEAVPGECYLVSDSIDLSAFAGQRVLVYGKPFSGLCSGTLARPCGYFEVRKIVSLAGTGVAIASWGIVKTIYR